MGKEKTLMELEEVKGIASVRPKWFEVTASKGRLDAQQISPMRFFNNILRSGVYSLAMSKVDAISRSPNLVPQCMFWAEILAMTWVRRADVP